MEVQSTRHCALSRNRNGCGDGRSRHASHRAVGLSRPRGSPGGGPGTHILNRFALRWEALVPEVLRIVGLPPVRGRLRSIWFRAPKSTIPDKSEQSFAILFNTKLGSPRKPLKRGGAPSLLKGRPETPGSENGLTTPKTTFSSRLLPKGSRSMSECEGHADDHVARLSRKMLAVQAYKAAKACLERAGEGE